MVYPLHDAIKTLPHSTRSFVVTAGGEVHAVLVPPLSLTSVVLDKRKKGAFAAPFGVSVYSVRTLLQGLSVLMEGGKDRH